MGAIYVNEEQKHEEIDKYKQLQNEFETILDLDVSNDDIVDEEMVDAEQRNVKNKKEKHLIEPESINQLKEGA